MTDTDTLTTSAIGAPGVEQCQAWVSSLAAHRHEAYRSIDGYRRDAFGPAWLNGQDLSAREVVLRRDLTGVGLDGRGRVIDGLLPCPYTARTTNYSRTFVNALADPSRRGATVVVDHVVSLAEAWHAGAWSWPTTTRIAFANDPKNLVATTWDVNETKAALSCSQWAPADRDLKRAFACRIVWVKHCYGLEVTGADRAWLSRALKSSWRPW